MYCSWFWRWSSLTSKHQETQFPVKIIIIIIIISLSYRGTHMCPHMVEKQQVPPNSSSTTVTLWEKVYIWT